MFSKTPCSSEPSPYRYILSNIYFFNNHTYPWSHGATYLGKIDPNKPISQQTPQTAYPHPTDYGYISARFTTTPHSDNEDEHDERDPSENDITPKITRQFYQEWLFPMLNSTMRFADREELDTNTHEIVEIPVTAKEMLSLQKNELVLKFLNPPRYSALGLFGKNCGHVQREQLKLLDPEECEKFEKQHSLLDTYIAWPKDNQELANIIANKRRHMP